MPLHSSCHRQVGGLPRCVQMGDGCLLALVPQALGLNVPRDRESELGLGATPVQCLAGGWHQFCEPKVLAA